MKCPGEKPDQRPGLPSSGISFLLPEPLGRLWAVFRSAWLGEGSVLGAEGGRVPLFYRHQSEAPCLALRFVFGERVFSVEEV